MGIWDCITRRSVGLRRIVVALTLVSLVAPIALSPGIAMADEVDAVTPMDEPEMPEAEGELNDAEPEIEDHDSEPGQEFSAQLEGEQPDEETGDPVGSVGEISVAGGGSVCNGGLGVAVSGHVRSGELGYATDVTLLGIWSDSPNDLGWTQARSVSDTSGAYTFCMTESLEMNLISMRQLRVVARAKSSDLLVLGDSFSEPVGAACAATLAGCTVEVTMQAPTVTGEVRHASIAQINVPIEPGDEWFQSGYAFRLTDSKFAVAFPFAAGQYRLSAGAGELNNEGPPYFVSGEWVQSPLNGKVDFGQLELEPANLVVESTRPDGLESVSGSWAQISVVSPTPECEALSFIELLETHGCLTGLQVSGLRRGVARVAPGSHRILVVDQGFAPREVEVTVGANGPTAVSAGAQIIDGRVVVALAEPPITLAVEGLPADRVIVGTSLYSDSNQGFVDRWSWQPGSLSGDRFGWAPVHPGIYQLVFQTKVGARLLISEHIVSVVQSDQGMAISGRCAVDVTLGGQAVSCLNSEPRSGVHLFEFGQPDLVVDVCGLAGCQEGNFYFTLGTLLVTGAYVDEQQALTLDVVEIQSVEMSLARTGRHELWAAPTDNEDGGLLRPARQVVHFTRTEPFGAEPGELRVALCSEMLSETCGTPLPSADGKTSLTLQFSQFPLIGEIRGARVDGGEMLPLAGVHLNINSVHHGSGWAAATTNSEGKFGVDLVAGDYSVNVHPQDRYPHLAEFRFDLSVVNDGHGGVTASVLPFVLTVPTPNVVGELQGEVVPGISSLAANASQMREDQRWYHASSRIDADGRYRFNLPPGRWRISVNPHDYFDPLALYGAGFVEFEVAGDGSVSPGAADVHMPPTNIRLEAKQRTEDGNLITFTAGYAQLEIDVDGEWSSQPLINNSRSVSTQGWFGFAVTPGRYRLTVSNNVSSLDAVTTRRYLIVQDIGGTERICMTSAQPSVWPENCEGWEVNPTSLVMDGANLRGVVRAGGEPVGARLSAARWNGLDFVWLDHWSSVGQSGRFGLRLEPGTYQISFHPWWSSQFVETRVYLRVVAVGDAIQWCRVTFINGVPGSTCTFGDQLTSEQLLVDLNATNLHGRVVQAADPSIPVRGTWIRVDRDQDGVWTYWRHVSVGADGRFRTRIDNETPATPVKFRLVVDPPQDGSNLLLSRRVVELWAGDLDSDGEIVICRAQPADGGCGDSDRVIGDLLIELDAGNLVGTVRREVLSNGATETGPPVVGARVEFQRRENGYWSWFDYWAFTNSEGRYSADLPPGEYRITVHPPYESRSQMAPSRREFTVTASGSLTEDFVLPIPNVVVTLTVPESGTGIPAQGAWIYLERKRSGDDGWDFLDMHTHTDTQGVFSFHVPQEGAYRMVIHPPWNSSNAVRFMREFTVNEAGAVVGLESTISFPVPNLELKVHRPAGTGETTTQPMPSVYVYLMALQVYNDGEQNQWSWVAGGHTNRVGEVGFLVTEPGEYRVVVQAPWNRPEFVGFETDFTVTGIPGSLVIAQPPMPLVYPQANVEGVVRVDELRVNRFGWMIAWEVGVDRDTFQWAGHNDQSGRFGLRLTEGVYRVEAHPNWDFRNRGDMALGPIDVMVTVSAQGQVTACSYIIGGSNCLIDGRIDISLDHLPPNFIVTVFVSDGVPAVGALVRLSSDGRSWDFIADSQGKIAAVVRPGTFTVRVAAIVAGTVRVVSEGDIEHAGGESPTSIVMTLLAS